MFIAETVIFLDPIAPALLAGVDFVTSMPAMIAGLLAEGDVEAAPEISGFQKFLTNPFILPAGLFFLFYITFILPERRRKAEEARMMSALKKNDRVVTVGGIHGTVVSTANDAGVVTIRIDENSNTRIKVNRSAISTILGDGKENKESSDKETTSDTKDK